MLASAATLILWVGDLALVSLSTPVKPSQVGYLDLVQRRLRVSLECLLAGDGSTDKNKTPVVAQRGSLECRVPGRGLGPFRQILSLRRSTPASPMRPEPNIANVPGSGTGFRFRSPLFTAPSPPAAKLTGAGEMSM